VTGCGAFFGVVHCISIRRFVRVKLGIGGYGELEARRRMLGVSFSKAEELSGISKERLFRALSPARLTPAERDQLVAALDEVERDHGGWNGRE
jgi:hypothetical protein